MKNTSKQQRPNRHRLPGNIILVFGGVGLVVVIVIFGAFAFRGGGESHRSGTSVRQPTVVATSLETTVRTVDMDYEPSALTVSRGATVTWHNDGALPHTVTDDRGAFDSDVFGAGERYAHTFDTAGTFYYYCKLHHVMVGTLTVAP